MLLTSLIALTLYLINICPHVCLHAVSKSCQSGTISLPCMLKNKTQVYLFSFSSSLPFCNSIKSEGCKDKLVNFSVFSVVTRYFNYYNRSKDI